MSELTDGQRELAALIDRIFEDGVVDAAERQQLARFWANKGLTVRQVREVVDAFVERVWADVIEDGVVTDGERERLQAVVSGLSLPESILPEKMREAL